MAQNRVFVRLILRIKLLVKIMFDTSLRFITFVFMNIKEFFLSPVERKQVLYEALRCSFVDELPDKEVCEKFNLNINTFKSARTEFVKSLKEKGDAALSFFIETKVGKRAVKNDELEDKIITMRRNNLSITDILSVLCGEGTAISLWKINQIIKNKNLPVLSRRTAKERERILLPEKITPPKSGQLLLNKSEKIHSANGSIFLFYPILKDINIDKVIMNSSYPETERLSRFNLIMSFLALKLCGTERLSHESDYALDRGLGLFGGLNVLPKTATLSSYSYKINRDMNKEFIRSLNREVFSKLPDSGEFNLDFTTIPHWGDESVLEKHWSNTRHIGIKSILALLVQDQKNRNIIYTDAENTNSSSSDAILEFIDFYRAGNNNLTCLIFDSKFTTYKNLSKINHDGIKFITLRRRGQNIVSRTYDLPKKDWVKVTLTKQHRRKYRNLLVWDEKTTLKDYEGEVRQLIITNNGRENPTFLITNDFDLTINDIVLKYGQRWLVEQSISEKIDFFHLNKVGSSIIIKVDFDLTMTLLADTIYKLFVRQFQGFEHKKVKTIHRDLIKNHTRIEINEEVKSITVSLNKKSHLPIIMEKDWFNQETVIPWLNNFKLKFTVTNTT